MPLSKYYSGHGEEVARSMKKKYGKRWQQVFYATANKKGMTGSGKMKLEDLHKGYKRY